MDAITLLKDDHRTVEELFKKFEGLGPRAIKGRREIVDRIIRELSIHATIEEVIFYPAIRQEAETTDKTDDMVLESLEEHHVLKWTLKELEGMDPAHERFDAKVTVLMESVRHHVKEEEKDLFPEVRKMFGRARLVELGDAMAELKKTAPTRPHPRQPDEPPGNLVTGAAAAIADRTLEAGKRLLRSA
jgi:hemerythrin superfamily protein